MMYDNSHEFVNIFAGWIKKLFLTKKFGDSNNSFVFIWAFSIYIFLNFLCITHSYIL